MLHALAHEPDPPTTVREPGQAVDAHVADSLVALELSEVRDAPRIADLGAGAGFPGLALAIALPEASVDLVESNRRKCAVIERLAEAGAARNARPVAERAETWASTEGGEAYALVTARALAPLAVLAEYAAPLLVEGGHLVAWKGRRDEAEELAGDRAAARLGLGARRVVAVTPFSGAHSRHLHVYVKERATPPGIPRRPGLAVKRPLG